MSAPTREGAGEHRLRDEADLCEALRTPFSAEQLAAITAPLEPGVIIAGAGSGKTTVMAARVVWLVGTGAVRPEEVLGLTFTRKAAAELSQRVRVALESAGLVGRDVDESGEQLVMTYDAFAGRLVAEHGLRLGFEADPTMISGATRFRLASRVVRDAAGPFDYLSRLRPATVTERVLRLDADLQQHLVDPRALDRHARELLVDLESAPRNNRGNVYVDVRRAALVVQERLELASLVVDYQRLKQRLGLVEFADQMAIAARLATELPEVSRAVRGAFRVVLLDEYQDTSAGQATLLRGLFSGQTPAGGLGHAVTAVGDPFQAIYGWRGAAASNIVEFPTDFPRRDGRPARRFTLTVNRRSGQEILDLANALSRPLRAVTFAEGGLGERPPAGLGLLRAPAEAAPAVVRAATFESWADEVAWVADQVVAARVAATVPRWADIAILTRRNADIGPIYAALTARDVPVEIVGLGGLLNLPEIADIRATLRLVDDVTANPELVRLLTGPRWRIGPRDLALLGRRARDLAPRFGEGTGEDGLARALTDAVAEVDPADVVCLLDALDDPGDLPYSEAARRRFGPLSAELAYLRRHADEPVLDLIRRVVATSGLDVEMSATPELARTARRDQLGAFIDAVADYVDVDGDASLGGLLGYLDAEAEQGAGLEQAVPSDREAVKLLTVHKAKGLEWPVVFLPALVKGVFPSDRVTDNWVTNPAVLPADLRGDAGSVPQLAEASNAAIGAYKVALTQQQLLAEDRLAYVAATRAKRLLVGSGHWWRADLVSARQPSTYLTAILAAARPSGEVVTEAPPPGAQNPLVVSAVPVAWPAPPDPEAAERRQQAADRVEAARERRRPTAEAGEHGMTAAAPWERGGTAEPPADPAIPQLLLDDEEIVAGWDSDLQRLLGELAEQAVDRTAIVLPPRLSATAVLRVYADPEGFAAELARPMPRPPSRAARFGTRFHAWVERYFAGRLPSGGLGQRVLVDPDDLTDRADVEAGDEAELRGLCRAFAAGSFGETVPYAVEAPFTLQLAGRLVRGRIDAVYRVEGDGRWRYRVVDWKTGQADPGGQAGQADPLQLAIYRLAWAELVGVPLASVDAVFYFVRSDRTVRPEALPDRHRLEAMLLGEADRITLAP